MDLKRIDPPRAGEHLEIRDTACDGLRLRVTSKGNKSWCVVYRVAGAGPVGKRGRPGKGKTRRYTLEEPFASYRDARKQALEVLEAAANGVDYAEQRKEAASGRSSRSVEAGYWVGGDQLPVHGPVEELAQVLPHLDHGRPAALNRYAVEEEVNVRPGDLGQVLAVPCFELRLLEPVAGEVLPALALGVLVNEAIYQCLDRAGRAARRSLLALVAIVDALRG
jgi:hypothetical protein